MDSNFESESFALNSDSEELGTGLTLFISKEHRFGTDAVLLAEFAAPRRKDSVCDLGTGCGIIPFLLIRDFGVKSITAVDIQNEAIALLNKSIVFNNINSIIPINSDMKDLSPDLNGTFDVVTCNPPYKAVGTGILSDGSAKVTARHEVSCTIDDVCNVSKRLLKSGGKLCMINRAERLPDVITSMRIAHIEPKRLRFISKNKSSSPVLFLIEGIKDGKPFMKIAPPYFTHEGTD